MTFYSMAQKIDYGKYAGYKDQDQALLKANIQSDRKKEFYVT